MEKEDVNQRANSDLKTAPDQNAKLANCKQLRNSLLDLLPDDTKIVRVSQFNLKTSFTTLHIISLDSDLSAKLACK